MNEAKQKEDTPSRKDVAPKAANIPHTGPLSWVQPKNTPENWKTAEKKKNAWRSDEKEFYNALQKLSQLMKKKEESRLDFAKSIPATDGTYLEESPMSRMILERIFRQNMAIMGFKWAAQILVAPEEITPYMKQVDEGVSWAMKEAGAEELV